MSIKKLRETKGQMRVIETILASFIVVAAFSFVGIFARAPSSPGYEITDLEKMGYSALHDLDQQGLLAPLVYNQNWSDIRIILKITMPNDVYFSLSVYNLGEEIPINSAVDSQILYGDSATFSDAKNVASVTYSLVGNPELNTGGVYETKYDPRILVLILSRG